MSVLGRHVLAEFHNANSEVLNDESLIKDIMNNSANEAGATIVTSNFHKFNPHGVSGVVIIAESHLAIHTWPEYGYASVDLFTCGDTVDPWVAFKYIKKAISASKYEAKEIKRGIFNENEPPENVEIKSFEISKDLSVVV